MQPTLEMSARTCENEVVRITSTPCRATGLQLIRQLLKELAVDARPSFRKRFVGQNARLVARTGAGDIPTGRRRVHVCQEFASVDGHSDSTDNDARVRA